MINVTVFREQELSIDVKNHHRKIKLHIGVPHRSGDWLDGRIEVPLSQNEAEQLLANLARVVHYNANGAVAAAPSIVIRCTTCEKGKPKPTKKGAAA